MGGDLRERTLKNYFINSLRDFLMRAYCTDVEWTFGKKGDLKGETCVGGSYAGIVREEDDLSGFVFRRDLCQSAPSSPRDLLSDVVTFVGGKTSLESKLISSDLNGALTVSIGSSEYLIFPQFDGGYVGEFGISLVLKSFKQ